MSNKQIIVFCFVAVTLCACNSKPKASTTEPPASQEQVAQIADDNHPQCGDTICKDGEICENNQCVTTELSDGSKPVEQVADEDHPQCGETICQYKEVCKDNQCKTAFEMNVFLAPIPKEGDVRNDSFDYWECQSETCTYHTYREVFTIPRGLRVRENTVYCGGEGIDLSEMKNFTCTQQGWVCSAPEGCGNCEGECRYNSCSSVTCSPGEKCFNGIGCQYADRAIENIFKCEEGHYECGSQQCGQNQICAYGNCYFAGEKKNGFADCKFIDEFDICGTSDIPEHLVRYICPERCPSVIPPENADDYVQWSFTLGDCHGVDVELWTCKKEEGCQCGEKHCFKDAACVDGRCALFISSLDIDSIEDLSFASTCATDYPSRLSYQPKDSEHYIVKKASDSWYAPFYWMCDDSNKCICDGKLLPPDMICHGEKDGTEHIACIGGYPEEIRRAPVNIENYRCEDSRWVCQNDKCLCGNKPLPKNAHCMDEKIYCDDKEIPTDMTGYECSLESKKWVCTSEKCLCGGLELRPGIDCRHLNKNDYQCCGIYNCFTSQTASERDCINNHWNDKAEIEQRHCRNKLLPPEVGCISERDWNENKLTEFAKCGDELLDNWDDYRCENNTWKCALKDKPCTCNGKPLPEGARCMDNKAYCDSFGREDWEGFECRDGKWITPASPEHTSNHSESDDNTKSALCYRHKLAEGVRCPSYDDNTQFVSDIQMSEMESCEHVRGCLCHKKLCPPSGICTENGCIDPLTNKLFESKDGYLVSDKLQQCANPNGCKCGENEIEYRDYCYNNEQYISMKSCVSDNIRMIGENNYITYDCNYGSAPWENDCWPGANPDPSQYFVRDYLTAIPSFFSDRAVEHSSVYVCIQKEGCECIHNKCKYGEACYKGQCVDDYPCHDVADYGEDEADIGKCRPINPEG